MAGKRLPIYVCVRALLALWLSLWQCCVAVSVKESMAVRCCFDCGVIGFTLIWQRGHVLMHVMGNICGFRKMECVFDPIFQNSGRVGHIPG